MRRWEVEQLWPQMVIDGQGLLLGEGIKNGGTRMPNLEQTEAKGEIKGSGRGVELDEGGPKDREADRGRR